MAMNPEVKAKWIAKLRDPEVKQTTKCLKDSNGFCCLGVLTDIYIKEHPERGDWVTTNNYTTYNDKDDVLTEVVRVWAGLPMAVGATIKVTQEDYPLDKSLVDDGTIDLVLSEANDIGLTFPVIAKYIEEQL